MIKPPTSNIASSASLKMPPLDDDYLLFFTPFPNYNHLAGECLLFFASLNIFFQEYNEIFIKNNVLFISQKEDSFVH